MNNQRAPIIFLSGAGGGAPDLNLFRTGPEDLARFEVVSYPGWKRFASRGFSAQALIAEIVQEIEKKVPNGPIRIVGLSIGGHFGYAAALHLEAMGREVGGFCAIDTFMIASSKLAEGWKGRALTKGLELLRDHRFGEFALFLRSKFWRALLRLAGSQLPDLLQKFSSSSRLLMGTNSVFEGELSMRLLIQESAPWIASLDRDLVPLKAPSVLLRTQSASSDDSNWLRRCPNIKIYEISGRHDTLFEAQNIGSLREVFLSATQDWQERDRFALGNRELY